MPTPIQTQILDVVELRLANVTTANGYSTTVKKISRARLTPFVSGDLPAINFWGGIDIKLSGGGGFDERQLKLLVEYHAKTRDRTFSEVSAELAADVWLSLWRDPSAPAVSDTTSPKLGDLVSSISLNTITPEIGEGQAPWCGALLEIDILYIQSPHDPFTLAT